MSQRGRPKNNPLSDFASNGVFTADDPDEYIGGVTPPAWDGEASAVRPSAGTIAEGFHPDAPLPADEQNFLVQDPGKRLAYLDLLDAQNWIEPLPLIGLGSGAPNAFRGACALNWHESRRLLVVGNAEEAQESWDGGYSWAAAFTIAGGTMIDCATIDYSDAAGIGPATGVIYLEGTDIKIGMRGASGVWASTVITNADAGMTTATLHGRLCPDPYLGKFWVAGRAAGTPSVFRIDQDDGTLLSQANLAGAGPQVLLSCIAKSPTHGIAAPGVGSGTNRVFRWANADAALSEYAPPWTAGAVFDLLWDNENGVFIAIAEDGSGLIEVWRSGTGASGSWTQVTAQPIVGKSGIVGGGCVRGSVVIVPCFETAPTPDRYWLGVSTDGGLTWELLPTPMMQAPSGSSGARIGKVRTLDRRFGSFAYDAAGDAAAVLSMRTGRL